MDKEVTRARIGKLSAREREVLSLFCEGKPYKEIAKSLFIVEKTVRVHMGNIYAELGLDYLEASAERRKLLHEIFCPLLKEDLPPPPEEPKALVPISPELEKKVAEDEHALVRIEPKIIDWPPPPPRRRRSCVWIALLLLIGVIVGIGGTALTLNWLGFFGGTSAQVSPTSTFEEVAAADGTQEASETPMPSPTETMTVTITPTLTPPPPTAIPLALPFSDNFENGTRPEWSFYGNWLVTNGRLSVVYDESEYRTAVLDLSGWQNYRIKVDLFIPHYGSANTGETAIFVRLDEINSTFIGFYQDYFGRGGWAYYPSDYSDPQYLGPNEEMDSVPQSATIELEVVGNQFTAYVNGIQYQQISITGYDSGVVILAIQCKSSTSCPSFDNFSVEPIG